MSPPGIPQTRPLSPQFLRALMCEPVGPGAQEQCAPCDRASEPSQPLEASPADHCTSESCAPGAASSCIPFLNESEPPKTFYLNGIQTSRRSAAENVRTIENEFGQEVELIYNETEGFWNDVAESYLNISGYDTEISQRAEERFRSALENGENVRIYAHSQGLAIAADALRNVAAAYRAEGQSADEVQEIMRRVQVISFGGFSSEEVFPAGTRTILQEYKDDSIPELAERALEVGSAFEQGDWGQFGISLAKSGVTLGEVALSNGGQALGSAWRNRGKLFAGVSAAVGSLFSENKSEMAQVAKTNFDAFGSALYEDTINRDHGFNHYWGRYMASLDAIHQGHRPQNERPLEQQREALA